MIAKAQNTPLDKVRVLQRSLYRAAKANPTRKFGVLYDKVCRDDVLRIACLRSGQGQRRRPRRRPANLQRLSRRKSA